MAMHNHNREENKEFSEKVRMSLKSDDGSAFYEYRIINLRKLFPYIPRRLREFYAYY